MQSQTGIPGASLVHIHVRNPDEPPSSNPELFAAVQDGGRRHSRGNALELRPEMASLSTGSVNFPTSRPSTAAGRRPRPKRALH